MIKRGIVIKRIIERRSAKFYLRLQDGQELWIRNCHLLNTPEESYLGTCEFFCKQTENVSLSHCAFEYIKKQKNHEKCV